MRLALIQFNPTVGDIRTNARRISDLAQQAASDGASLVVFPELAICGYPPRDLLLQEGFLDLVREVTVDLASELARTAPGATVVIGAPWGKPHRLTNSLLVLRQGAVDLVYDKRLLPTYDVFDEDRYFCAGDTPCILEHAGVRIGLSICEDLWRGADALHEARYARHADPMRELIDAGAHLILNPSGSPFVIGKGDRQREITRRHVANHRVALATVNQVGGNDDQIFDGHAALYVPSGEGPRLVLAGPGFEETIVAIDLPDEVGEWSNLPEVPDPRVDAPKEKLLFEALVLGTRDYCRKTGFTRAVLGLSGGIDSALTCCIAARALGPENVLGVALPSRYSSSGSVEDAKAMAERLGIAFEIVSIEDAHACVEASLAAPFEHRGYTPEPGVTEENLQPRLRGLILMAFSNKSGAILLTTGNKSEVAVGYCTLYGDMNGGLAVLSDVTKIDVYAVSRWINARAACLGLAGPPIPESTITKPPSAELKPDQLDQDTLPPYEVLDQVVERYIEQRQSPGRIATETGIEAALVDRTVRMIDVNEYKRIQMPVGLKVSRITFGPGRRHPIAQGYRPRATED